MQKKENVQVAGNTCFALRVRTCEITCISAGRGLVAAVNTQRAGYTSDKIGQKPYINQ